MAVAAVLVAGAGSALMAEVAAASAVVLVVWCQLALEE